MKKEINIKSLLNFKRKLEKTTDLDKILKAIGDETSKLLDADRTTIYVYDEDKNELWSTVAQNLEIDEVRLAIGKGIAGEVAQSRQILNIEDAYSYPSFNPDFDKKTKYKTNTILAAPMISIENKLIGVIQVINKKKALFEKTDEELLVILCNVAAIAIEQAQLFKINVLLREYTENILQNLSSALLVLDEDYNVRLINRYCEQLFNINLENETNKCVFELLNFVPQIDVIFDMLKTSSSLVREKVKIEFKDNEMYLNLRINKFEHEKDSGIEYIILIDDVTDIVHLENENKRQEKLSLIGNMTSKVVHDFKNPLSVMKGFTYLIKQKTNSKSIQKYVKTIEDEINRFNGMIVELLEFVRGQSFTNLQRTYFDEFIRDLCSFLNKDLKIRGIKLRLNNKYKGLVILDTSKFRRVFYNLVSNAKAAMPSGGIYRIKAYQEEDKLIITITDNGKGMPDEVKENIFKPFLTHGKKEGTGLGMAIVHKIVKEHKGEIFVKSKLDVGTKIIIKLPLDSNY